jgi:DNA-binding response OmpR family regulator
VTTAILLLEKDLFFSVRIRDTLRHYAMAVRVVRDGPAFSRALAESDPEPPALAIVNMATPGVDWEAAIREARQHDLPVLAFGPHVDQEARRRALAAGAHQVVSNARLSSSLPALVQALLARESLPPASMEESAGE